MLKLITLLLVTMPSLAFAQVATSTITLPNPGGDPGGFLALLLKAYQDKDWALLAGAILSVVIWALKKFGVLDKIKLGSKWGIRISTLALAVLTSIAIGLIGHQGWQEILKTGVQVAFMAVGGWEFIGKLFRGKVDDEGPTS